MQHPTTVIVKNTSFWCCWLNVELASYAWRHNHIHIVFRVRLDSQMVCFGERKCELCLLAWPVKRISLQDHPLQYPGQCDKRTIAFYFIRACWLSWSLWEFAVDFKNRTQAANISWKSCRPWSCTNEVNENFVIDFSGSRVRPLKSVDEVLSGVSSKPRLASYGGFMWSLCPPASWLRWELECPLM